MKTQMRYWPVPRREGVYNIAGGEVGVMGLVEMHTRDYSHQEARDVCDYLMERNEPVPGPCARLYNAIGKYVREHHYPPQRLKLDQDFSLKLRNDALYGTFVRYDLQTGGPKEFAGVPFEVHYQDVDYILEG